MQTKFGVRRFLSFLLISVMTSAASFAAEPNLEGFYKGIIVKTNSKSFLPEKITMGLVVSSVQGVTATFTSAARLFSDDKPFSSNEYEELQATRAEYDYLKNAITVRIDQAGLTLKLKSIGEGVIKGTVYSDSLEEVGKVLLGKF